MSQLENSFVRIVLGKLVLPLELGQFACVLISHADAAGTILLHLDCADFELNLAFGKVDAEVGDQTGGLLALVTLLPVQVASFLTKLRDNIFAVAFLGEISQRKSLDHGGCSCPRRSRDQRDELPKHPCKRSIGCGIVELFGLFGR